MERKVHLVSGDATGSEEPGWFRLLFSQSPESVREGVMRIVEAIS